MNGWRAKASRALCVLMLAGPSAACLDMRETVHIVEFEPQTWVCDGGKTVVIHDETFGYRYGATVTVTAGGMTRVLEPAWSREGQLHRAGQQSVRRTIGKLTARGFPGGPYNNCILKDS